PARAGRRPGADPRRNEFAGLVALCLALAAVILAVSWLVGALDAFAVGAVVGVWALCVATRLILGRHGEDWTVPVRSDQLRALSRAGLRQRISEPPSGLGAGAVSAERAARARAARERSTPVTSGTPAGSGEKHE
ncbi:hypothetical protein I6A94_27755, partial [Frankia sp. CN4]|nr:hypothetical protein [Frankia nepalensis]